MGVEMSIYIYLVVGSVDYETNDVIGVFTSSNKAEAFRDMCYKYNETKPEALSINLPDDVWEKRMLKHNAWDKAHPAGGEHDFYTISKMELK
jgi:hypothetical protein